MNFDSADVLEIARRNGSDAALCMSKSYEEYLLLCRDSGSVPVRPGLYRIWEMEHE